MKSNGESKKNGNNGDEGETENAVDANFTVTSKLIWPVEGNDIIDFDMENTVYFPTLDLYKCSDAVYIQSDVGTPVYAGHACKVEEIGYDSEIGNNVTVEMGNGYVITYGQLRDVQIEKGTVLEEGELIGYVASPTKYFSLEGSHLYIKMTKDGEAVDPLDYLNY
jgi:murein DD-endopeptidase MepM/ murein hydrolase activator NlpD